MDKLEFIASLVTISSMALAIIFSMVAIIRQNNRQAILADIYEYLQSIYENQNEFDKDDFIEGTNREGLYTLMRISDIESIRRVKPYEHTECKYTVTLISGKEYFTNFIPERCADLIDHHNY